MNPETWLGLGALVVALWSAIETRLTARKQTVLQERMLSLENARERERRVGEQRAAVRADFIPTERSGRRLRVVNEGAGQARMIRILADGEALKDSELFYDDEVTETLGPGAHSHYLARAHMGMSKSIFRIRIEWDDDSGIDGVWESDLKL